MRIREEAGPDGDNGGGGSLAEKLAPPAPDTSEDFSAAFNRTDLIANVPEGMDAEKFGNWLDKTADPYVAYKSYSEIEKMKSKGLPNENWGDEDWANLNKAMGVPEEAEGYQFGDDVSLDDVTGADIRNLAKELGLRPNQAEGIAKKYGGMLEAAKAAQAESNEAADQNTINYLADAWGHPDSKGYQENFALTKAVLESKGIDTNSEVGDAIYRIPQVVEMLAEHAKMMKPSDLPAVNAGNVETPRSIDDKMDKVMADMSGMDINSPQWQAKDQEYQHLFKQKQRISR